MASPFVTENYHDKLKDPRGRPEARRPGGEGPAEGLPEHHHLWLTAPSDVVFFWPSPRRWRPRTRRRGPRSPRGARARRGARPPRSTRSPRTPRTPGPCRTPPACSLRGRGRSRRRLLPLLRSVGTPSRPARCSRRGGGAWTTWAWRLLPADRRGRGYACHSPHRQRHLCEWAWRSNMVS